MTEIKGYNGLYSISTDGVIKNNKTEKMLAVYITHSGVLKVTLYKEGKPTVKAIHRLVAETYIDNPDNKPQVDHIDGNKQNNNVSNLRWCTNQENQSFRNEQGNTGREGVSKGVKVGSAQYTSIREASIAIATKRGSKPDTVRKELKALRYGPKYIYNEWCELCG